MTSGICFRQLCRIFDTLKAEFWGHFTYLGLEFTMASPNMRPAAHHRGVP
jgi:hypothetical protein